MPGKYRGNLQAADKCLPCEKGLFSSEEGQSFCLDCDAGKFANETMAKKCLSCPFGQYQDGKREIKCKTCEGTDIPNEQQVGCMRPPFRLPTDCKKGTEFLNDSSPDNMQWSCERCIAGADCTDFPRLTNLLPSEDHRQMTWTDEINPGYGACPAALACHWNFTSNNGCRVGHNPNSSELCSTCLSGWASRTKTQVCRKCPDRVSTAITFVLACIAIVGVFAYLVWDSLDGASDMIAHVQRLDTSEASRTNSAMPFHCIAIRIVSSFLQTSAMLLSFDIALPSSVRTLFVLEMSASSLSSELMQFDCVTDERDDGYVVLLCAVISIFIFFMICCLTRVI